MNQLKELEFDAAVITGDTADAASLPGELAAMAETCAPRPVYFVLGNHDYFGGTFFAVDAAVVGVCARHRNLRRLDREGIVPLSRSSALIGHGGWADARAGYGKRSILHNPDADNIEDFHDISADAVFSKMQGRAGASAMHLRKTLPLALTNYRHVLVATHVPPFTQAARFDGNQCGPLHLPHFSNISAGGVIRGISQSFPDRRVTVICGHTHSAAEVDDGPVVRIFAGGVKPGQPAIQRVFEVE